MTDLKTCVRPVIEQSLPGTSCDDEEEGNRLRRELTHLAELYARVKALCVVKGF